MDEQRWFELRYRIEQAGRRAAEAAAAFRDALERSIRIDAERARAAMERVAAEQRDREARYQAWKAGRETAE